jgi:hypothetical protein
VSSIDIRFADDYIQQLTCRKSDYYIYHFILDGYVSAGGVGKNWLANDLSNMIETAVIYHSSAPN